MFLIKFKDFPSIAIKNVHCHRERNECRESQIDILWKVNSNLFEAMHCIKGCFSNS